MSFNRFDEEMSFNAKLYYNNEPMVQTEIQAFDINNEKLL